jgi:hypothetical protein
MSNPVIEDGTQALDELLRLGDLMTPMTIRAASSLGLPDHIDEDGVTVSTLAQRLAACPEALQRMLQLLAVAGVVALDDSGKFSLTDIGRVLRSDHPLSMCDAYALAAPDVRSWSQLEHCMRTGQSGFERSYGESHRSYRAKNLAEDVRMDRAHQAATRLDILTLVRSYPWQGVTTLVDVGGGTGTFLAGVLRRVPGLQGTLFDLPRMVANAASILAAAGVAERCKVVGGDFFNDVPAGAEVYVLKAVVGGWDDAAVVKMLSVVRRAMRPDSRVLLIEPVMGAGKEFRRSNVVQLHSFVLYGGRFRTVDDYRSLVQAAELQIRQVILRETLSIIELVPRAPD